MRQKQSINQGIIIFAAIALIVLVICLFAYMVAGEKGIEERFSDALGLPGEPKNADNGIFGFRIEGNLLSFGIILALILFTTALMYAKFKI